MDDLRAAGGKVWRTGILETVSAAPTRPIPHATPDIGSMDGNTGRSEGATAEKAVPFLRLSLILTVRR